MSQLSLALVVCLTIACTAPVQTPVRPGIDVLLTDSVHLIRNKRVGLITNQTGVDQHGRDDVSRLIEAGIELTALFSPEHGFRGTLDQANISHSFDSATGIPIYSLYGAQRAPAPEVLAEIDVLLVDLQDIGSRTYTYVSTAILAMEEAAAVGVPVLILDRPNPIGGELIQGPTLDPSFASFVGMLAVPLRHGMTIGELTLLAKADRNLDLELTVVPALGWTRDLWFDETGLPWVRPSPNMPSLESATHYPGTVLFEATNLSVGRGTPIAFQVIGASWLDPERVIPLLADHPGLAITDTTVVPASPSDGKYDGTSIRAVRLLVTNRSTYDPVRLAADLFDVVRRVHQDSLSVRGDAMDRLAGTDQMRSGAWTREGVAAWAAMNQQFRERRARFLIY